MHSTLASNLTDRLSFQTDGDELDALGEEFDNELDGDIGFDAATPPRVYPVFYAGRRADGTPLFRVRKSRVSSQTAKRLVQSPPSSIGGIFVMGGKKQAKDLSRVTGLRLTRPERHKQGLTHYHGVSRSGDRLPGHIWFGWRIPEGRFFDDGDSIYFDEFGGFDRICSKCQQDLDRFDEFAHRSIDLASGKFNLDEANYVNWVRNSLNRHLRTKLRLNGTKDFKYRQAVKRFQKSVGLNPDGLVGAKTQNALIKANARNVFYILWVQDILDEIQTIGRHLNPKLFRRRVPIERDNDLKRGRVRIGLQTRKLIRQFQRWMVEEGNKISVDAVVGPRTEFLLMAICSIVLTHLPKRDCVPPPAGRRTILI